VRNGTALPARHRGILCIFGKAAPERRSCDRFSHSQISGTLLKVGVVTLSPDYPLLIDAGVVSRSDD
jgi:hypothetical protein